MDFKKGIPTGFQKDFKKIPKGFSEDYKTIINRF